MYPQVDECLGKTKSRHNALPSYQFLFGLKQIIPKELYAYYYRKLLQFNTENVSMELRLKMFEGVDRCDLMYQDELDAIRNFDDVITVYRGTTRSEMKPGLSWTRRRDIAEGVYGNGRLFIAAIQKSDILLYFMHEEDEEEIVAYIVSNYEIVDY